MKIFLLLSFVLSAPALATNELYVMGAGGEPEGPTTIFDNSMRNIVVLARAPGWQSTVSFNGGHATTERLVSNGHLGLNPHPERRRVPLAGPAVGEAAVRRRGRN